MSGPSVRRGRDRAFSAGADISGFADRDPAQTSEPTDVFTTVAEYPRPTLARIDGYCLGAGLELPSPVTSGWRRPTRSRRPRNHARPATRRRRDPARDPNVDRRPGEGTRVRGEHISAERAADWGLINRAVDADEFDDVVGEFVDDLVSGPPLPCGRPSAR